MSKSLFVIENRDPETLTNDYMNQVHQALATWKLSSLAWQAQAERLERENNRLRSLIETIKSMCDIEPRSTA